mgnify:CR=1 FL=1|tara:strand:- start:13734 stop:14162 length:429 start_codon:yes stop_codon:yes gene_type:complete
MSVQSTKQNPFHGWLVLYLNFIGYVSLLAFGAAVMPSSWMITTADALGVELADLPLSFYLARNLSLLYGFVGATLLVITHDMSRYGSLVWFVARGTLLLGVLQLVANSMSGLPIWWTLGESVSTFCGGLLMWWLDRRAHQDD